MNRLTAFQAGLLGLDKEASPLTSLAMVGARTGKQAVTPWSRFLRSTVGRPALKLHRWLRGAGINKVPAQRLGAMQNLERAIRTGQISADKVDDMAGLFGLSLPSKLRRSPTEVADFLMNQRRALLANVMADTGSMRRLVASTGTIPPALVGVPGMFLPRPRKVDEGALADAVVDRMRSEVENRPTGYNPHTAIY